MEKKYKPISDEGAENLIIGILSQTRKDIQKGRSYKGNATWFLHSEYGKWMMDVASHFSKSGREAI